MSFSYLCSQYLGHDGMSWYSFQNGIQLLNLKMRWCGRLLNNDQAICVSLIKVSIAHSLDIGYRHKSRRYWSGVEALLLDKKIDTLVVDLQQDQLGQGIDRLHSQDSKGSLCTPLILNILCCPYVLPCKVFDKGQVGIV